MAEKKRTKLEEDLFREFDKLPIICIHSHIEAKDPASHNLVDILGYHYYTELANSSMYEKDWLPEEIDAEEKIRRIISKSSYITHTTQYSWLITLAKFFFGFKHECLTLKNWKELYDSIIEKTSSPKWYSDVVRKSNIEKVFLTNNFYEGLDGIAPCFVPCLRADDIVFKIHEKSTRKKLESVTNISIEKIDDFDSALHKRFDYFLTHGAASAAISLPPKFETRPVSKREASKLWDKILVGKDTDDLPVLQAYVMNKICEECRSYSIPFQLMIGVLRGRYKHGVYQGRDLLTPLGSMEGYEHIFNEFPDVGFLISVLPDTQLHEMRTYCWIRHNVVVSGHWWYQNTPSIIKPDLETRLEILPYNKLIGYYSDAYKLEFVYVKFRMYKKILAQVLAEKVVGSSRGDSLSARFAEKDAFEIGKALLYDNPKALLRGENE